MAWTSDGSAGTDTSGHSVQAQRYSGSLRVPSMSLAGRLAAWGALLLVGAFAALRSRA